MLKVLHVDDSKDDLAIISLHLARLAADLDIERVESAAAALQRIEEESFDCILSDYQMPCMNGLQFLKTIRVRGNDIPFIFLTGQGNEEVAGEALRLGADDYYSKDAGIAYYERLVNIIRRVVDVHQGRKQRSEFEKVIREVVEGTYAVFGTEFFHELIRHLAVALNVRYAFVGELIDQHRERIQTLSVWADGEYVENIEYDLANTPCEKVVSESICLIPRDVKKLFPEDTLLKEMGVESYIGVPLLGSKKDALGILVAMDDKPLEDTTFVRSMITIFAAKAGAELERKHNEESLLKLSSAVEQSPSTVIITDLNGNIEYVNPKFTKITGYTSDEVKDKNPRFLKSGEMSKSVYEEMWDTISSGAEWRGEFHNRKKNGELYWETASISAIKNSEGEVTNFLKVAEDITEKKNAEDELKRVSQLMETSIDNTSRWFSVMDESGSVVIWNKAAVAISGYSRDMVAAHGKIWDRLLPDKGDREKFREVISEVYECGKAVEDLKTIIRTSHGEFRDVVLSIRPVNGENDTPIGLVITGDDITELKLTQKMLSETQPQEDYKGLRDHINALDESSESRNSPLKVMLITTLSIFVSEAFIMLLIPVLQPLSVMETMLIDASLLTVLILPLLYLFLFKPLVDENQMRRKAELNSSKVLRQLNRQTIALESSKNELEKFSYSVSHDLRAPLRLINGYSSMLVDEYSDHLNCKGNKYLENIDVACRRMGELIDDLLSLSKLARHDLHVEEVDLSTLTETIAKNLKRTEPARKMEFVIADHVITKGDPRLLRIVLENLIGNAWKFTAPRHQAKIEFGTTVDANGSNHIYFIRDNGVGFDQAKAENIFLPFRRLHNSDQFDGSGIGLSTVQRIISLHGGRIWVESAVDKGATFYFTLD